MFSRSARRNEYRLTSARMRNNCRRVSFHSDTCTRKGWSYSGIVFPPELSGVTILEFGSEEAARCIYCIADVSGKGTPGALIAAMLYACVTSLSAGSDSPEFILSNVETILRNQLGEGHYVTIFYGVLDLKTRVLNFVNAGHCPPMLRRADGSIQMLGPTRPVLGLLLDAGLSSERLQLNTADGLLLYTDGVTEAADVTGEEFGSERLAATLTNYGDKTLPEQYTNIMENVNRHAAGQLSDDATLLLVSLVEPLLLTGPIKFI